MAARALVASALVHASVTLAFTVPRHLEAPVDVGRAPPHAVMGGQEVALEESPRLDGPSALAPSAAPIPSAPHAAAPRASGAEAPHTTAPRAMASALPGEPAVAASTRPPARFAMSLAAGSTSPDATGAPNAGSDGDAPSAAVYRESDVTVPARRLEGAPPEYPPAARAASIEGAVPLELVIASSGAVAEARVLRQAGYGLDEAALHAVRGYRFAPARREGRPVRVRMRWVVDFRLD